MLTRDSFPSDPLQPDYHEEAFKEMWGILSESNDLFVGSPLWIRNGEIKDESKLRLHLPQSQVEPRQAYLDRARRSLYRNYYRPAILGFGGLLSEFSPSTDLWPSLDDFIDDVDLMGASLSAFLFQLDVLAMKDGWAGVLVDYSSTPTDNDGNTLLLDLEQEKALEKRPYFRAIPKSSIINIGYSVGRNGKKELSRIVVSNIISEPEGTYGKKSVEQIIELVPGAYLEYRRDLPSATNMGTRSRTDSAPALNQELHFIGETPMIDAKGDSLTYIPFVFYPALYWAESLEPLNRANPMYILPPLYSLAEANKSHYQTSSDLFTILHKCNLPVGVRKGYATKDSAKLPPLIIGPNTVVDVPVDGDFTWQELNGSAIGSTREVLKDLEEYMLRLSLSFFGAGNSTGMTDIEARLRSAQVQASATQMASDKESAFQEMAKFWAQWEIPTGHQTPEVSGGTISVSRRLLSIPLSQEALNFLFRLMERSVLDRRTIIEIIAEQGFLPRNMTALDLIERQPAEPKEDESPQFPEENEIEEEELQPDPVSPNPNAE